MHQSLGNKWSAIAAHLPGRADNEVKNHWHTYLKKHLFPEQSSPSATLASHAATHSVTHSDHSPEKSFVEASSGEPEVHPDHAPSDTLNIASYAPLKSCTTYLPCSSSTSSPLSEPISISTVETGLIQTPISCNWEIGASSTEMLAVSPGRFWTEPFISETSVDTVIPGWDSGPYHFYGENFSFHLESPRFYDSIMMFKDH
ncbi:hypothetical protein SAY86_019527 [Trapa natans]|uniref:Uncharacterized protein n=1 Tax=Trapa natans TaxID=22666 RepID=A0AAN7R6X0_TRANT|nr:hypothetical protein SAY86_019527 [Trapa natans]